MTFRKDQLFVITDHETLTFPQKLRGGLSWDRSYLLPLIQLTRTLELASTDSGNQFNLTPKASAP
jgi:hypothetical protein